MLPAISWDDMSLEADPENGLFYGVETLARKVAAFRICDSGIETVWKKTQTTTEWATLIGPKEHRVWVGTDIPLNQIPGANANDRVVWRDASTGRVLARSALVPVMTQGSAVQPGYDGSMYFPGATGTLVRLTPAPVEAGTAGRSPNELRMRGQAELALCVSSESRKWQSRLDEITTISQPLQGPGDRRNVTK